MAKVLTWAGLSALLALSGCQYDFSPAAVLKDSGKMTIAATFTKGLTTKVIPGDTTTITVRVTGDKIPAGSVLTADLSPTNPKVTFVDVPSGLKNVKATAFDDSGNRLADGTTDVTIIAGTTITATITLQVTTDVGRFNLIIQ